jgi:hypothetical protein
VPYFKTNIADIAIGSQKNGRHPYPKLSFLSEPRRLFEICLIAQRIHRPWSLGRSNLLARLTGSVAGSHCDGFSMSDLQIGSSSSIYCFRSLVAKSSKRCLLSLLVAKLCQNPCQLLASSLCHSHILESCYISIATAAIVWLQLWKEFGAGVRGDSSESEMN